MAQIAGTSSDTLHLLYWAAPFLILIMGYVILRALYVPRSIKEWKLLITNSEVRSKMRLRKIRLDAIRRRKPGSILPGVPTSQRDFALEPLIRRRRFKEAKAYIMEQIRRHRDAGGSTTGRINVYLQYLELIEGTV
jgi:hypothetical protein